MLSKIIVAAALALSGLVGAVLGVRAAIHDIVSAEPQNLGSAFAIGERHFPRNDPSTSTVAYLTGGAAGQSFIIPAEDADLIDINLYAISSTTGTFRWVTEWSNDYNPTTGNGTWYGRDTKSVALASTTHSVQTAEDQWTPIASTSAKNFSIEPVASKFARITVYITGGNGAFHASAAIRKPLAR